MRLKNVLIVVKDIEKSKKYYRDLFGMAVICDNSGNVSLTVGLSKLTITFFFPFSSTICECTISVSSASVIYGYIIAFHSFLLHPS